MSSGFVKTMSNLAKKNTSGFECLPIEILLDIIGYIPDLLILRSLIIASPAVFRLFNAYGAEITDTVLNTSDMPHQIQKIIRVMVLIRSSSPMRMDVDEFIKTYIRGDNSFIPKTFPKCTPAAILRKVLHTAYQIRCLTHLCLQHYIDQCMSLKPSRLDTENITYTRIMCGRSTPQPPLKSFKYEPKDPGLPTRIEVERCAIGFWRVQMYYDLQNAPTTLSQQLLGWHDKLTNVGAAGLFSNSQRHFTRAVEPEQVRTVMAYIHLIETNNVVTRFRSDDDSDEKEEKRSSMTSTVHKKTFRLPWPEEAAAFDPEFIMRQPEFQEPNATAIGSTAATSKKVHRDSLDKQAVGYIVVCYMSTSGSRSPLRYVTFNAFRKLGFAIWSIERLRALGLVDPLGNHPLAGIVQGGGEMYFRWMSLLTDEELAENRATQIRYLGGATNIFPE